MTHTNPHTNTSSDVECINTNEDTLYDIACALYDIADRIRSQPDILIDKTSCSLTFFLPYNSKAKDVFSSLQRRFPFTNIVCTKYKRVHATVDEKLFTPVSINMMAEAKDVFEVRPITITKDAYYLNDELIHTEDL
jgi:hypothetical protein